MSLQSKLFRGDPKLEAAAVSNPAHILSGAIGPHVAKIQKALNILDGANLSEDGVYGPATAAAVLRYKRKRDIINRSYQTQADDIVGIMTMAALDREMSEKEGPAEGVPTLAMSSFGTCALLTSGGDSNSGSILPNPFIVGVIISLIPQVRIAINAADFLLSTAGPHVTNHKQTLPSGLFNEQARASLLLLDKVFDFFKFDNPRPVFDNLRTVYRNMIVALNRSFETAPLIAPTLFVPNTFDALEKVFVAYTSSGGAFRDSKVLFRVLPVPSNRIYLCSNLASRDRTFQIMTAVHELAHYVSGSAIEIVDPLHGHFFSPENGANANTANPVLNPKLKTLAPSVKIRDAEHYAAFAFLAARRRLAILTGERFGAALLEETLETLNDSIQLRAKREAMAELKAGIENECSDLHLRLDQSGEARQKAEAGIMH